MHTKLITRIFTLAFAIIVGSLPLHALDDAHFASTSRLNSGKWVKITISENGVYELTRDDLQAMNISFDRARVYGSGGHMISEVLANSLYDDLVPVPVMRTSDKIIFYAQGPIAHTLSDYRTSTPHYTRTVNAYSQKGYYFITESDEAETAVSNSGEIALGTRSLKASLDFYHHEQDLVSMSRTGKEMQGEDIARSSKRFAYNLPGLELDSALTVNVCVSANVTASSYVDATLHNGGASTEVPFTLASSRIYQPSSDYVFYNSASPTISVEPEDNSEQGEIEIGVHSTNGSVVTARVDYFILTYFHRNSMLGAVDNQMHMGYTALASNHRVDMSDMPQDVVVWNITNESNPLKLNVESYVDGETATAYKSFTPTTSTVEHAEFIAFSPSETLKKVTEFVEVENQNIHGLEVPDLVIVTTPAFIEQAERVAELHRQHDGMTVHVLDQNKIFNEFSSGGGDAMAVRLMCKMFYDRDNDANRKFRYLLMFGSGSYDNRAVIPANIHKVITYQSTVSNDEDYSYTSDDFFGMLDDNSGRILASDFLRLGVGRYTSADAAEAKSDVDKLYRYVLDPDYGAWRNNAFISCDEGDNDLHMFQAEGICEILRDDSETGLHLNRVYVPMFPKTANSRISHEARRKMEALLSEGQYYATYVGHAGPSHFSKSAGLWYASTAQSVEYPHVPIMSTACCDVARYDSDMRGIADVMFHNPNGGAIALITSSRSVYAESNDALNRAFTTAMMSFKEKGEMQYLGDAYMYSKQSFGTQNNSNKLSFLLLGDPAIKINYPKPYFKITTVNGTDVTGGTQVTTAPTQKVTVTAQVMNPDMETVNTAFNGNATLTLYDASSFYKTTTAKVNRVEVNRDVYYSNEVLAQVEGRVVNGIFTGSAVVPRNIKAQNANGMIRVYAHQDGTEEMVNGSYNNLRLGYYNASTAATDNEPPVINSMFINDETQFSEGCTVPKKSILYINVTDNYAVSAQSVSAGQNMTLKLDGGKSSWHTVKNYSRLSDDGCTLDIEFPLNDLTTGLHTLTFTVFDVNGNNSSRTVTFNVGPASNVTLEAQEMPAVEQATFDVTSKLNETPTLNVKITDATGNVVWQQQTSSSTFTWNLKDKNGNRVPAGIYRYFASYSTETEFSGTNIGELIVIDPVKTK